MRPATKDEARGGAGFEDALQDGQRPNRTPTSTKAATCPWLDRSVPRRLRAEAAAKSTLAAAWPKYRVQRLGLDRVVIAIDGNIYDVVDVFEHLLGVLDGEMRAL